MEASIAIDKNCCVCSGMDNQCQPCRDDFGLDGQERMGGAKSHKEDGLTAHEKYEKKHVHCKERKKHKTLLETDVGSPK